MKKIQPVNNYVLIQGAKEKEQKTASGIVIPDSAASKKNQGKIIGIAAGASKEIAVGDTVIYKEYSGTEIKFEGEEYLLLQVDDIIAKITEVDSI